MVTRSTARTFDKNDTTTQRCYHKYHINKSMAVAFTGYAFENRIDNGGEGVKLGFFRAQSNKVAKKQVKQFVMQEDGTRRAL